MTAAMHRLVFLLLLAILCISVVIPGFGYCGNNETSKIYLLGKQFDPLQEAPETMEQPKQDAKPRVFMSPLNVTPTFDYYIVQFTGPVKAKWKNELSARGVKFFDYIPKYAFIIRANTSLEGEISALSHVRWIGEYKPDYRVGDGVYDNSPEELEANENLVDLTIVAFPGEDEQRIRSAIDQLQGTVDVVADSEWSLVFTVKIPVTSIDDLKKVKGVKWIGRSSEHRINNNVATDILNARTLRETFWPNSGSRLFGEGQIVGICDSGIDTGLIGTINDDFGVGGNRIVDNVVFSGSSQKDYSGHGTHVAGSVLGNGINSGSDPDNYKYPDGCFAGIAPKAEAYFQTVGPTDGSSDLPGIPTDLSLLFQPAYDNGARIHTNSWGTLSTGGYNHESREVDQFVWTNKDMLILFAAGNSGVDRDGNGVVDLSSLDLPGSAKNCLTVGASESRRDIGGYSQDPWSIFGTYYRAYPLETDLISNRPYGLAAFSSRGPTQDGRYKPEVVAPGTDIISVYSSYALDESWGKYNDFYSYSGGTSMATPITAGTAALLREHFINEGFADPSAALLKTSLIHGAVDIAPGQYGTGPYKEVASSPDPGQGWGRVNLQGSITCYDGAGNPDARKVVYHDIKPGAEDVSYNRSFTFTVADNGAPFRATLGWTDYPGSEVVGGGLVNDLDLRVQTPGREWVYADNPRNLSTLDIQCYSSESGFPHFAGEVIAVRLTPSAYPSTLESVVIDFENSNSVLAPVDIVVYDWDGSDVGEEIYRKSIGFMPYGEQLIPVGITVSSGSVVVGVESHDSSIGVSYQDSNPSGRAFEQSGGVWQPSTVTPSLAGLFRTVAPAEEYDRVNNTESVTIPNPVPGTYTVEISAHNIPQGPQPYALVISGLTSVVSTQGDNSVEVDPNQYDAPNVTISSRTRRQRNVAEIEVDHGVSLNKVYGDVVSFRSNITGNYGQGLVSMRYAVTDLPAKAAGTLALTKLLGSGSSRTFNYPDFPEYEDGNWWLADYSGFVDPARVLNPDSVYYVTSVVKDNGPYDTNSLLNVVEDPQVLSSGGSFPSGGSTSSGGGCTLANGKQETINPLLLILTLFAIAMRLWNRTR